MNSPKNKEKPLIVRKNPIVIVRNFIILQFAAMLTFVGIGSLAHYARIYRSLAISKMISFEIAQGIFIFLAEIIIVFFILFRWHKEYYAIYSNKIVHGKGILFRHKNMISLEQTNSVIYRQGPLAKLLKYGTIRLIGDNPNGVIKLAHIPDPKEHTHMILRFKGMDYNRGINKVSDLKELIKQEEHEMLEFKSTLRWDIKGNKVNKLMEKSVFKTVAAFMNTDGGSIVLGVGDKKNLVGLEYDYASLGKPNSDGLENHFSHVFHSMIGSQFRYKVKLNWVAYQGKECCIINVGPSSVPVYLRYNGREEFFIRTGNATTSLELSEATAYMKKRFST